MRQNPGVKEALLYGNEKGYGLFPEIKDMNVINRIKTGKHGQQMADQLRAYCREAMGASPALTFSMFMEFERTGNRIIYENAYFERRKQLFTLVLTYVLDHDERLMPMIEQKLWEWCEVYSWELPAHYSSLNELPMKQDPDVTVGLFAAESAFFFAEILSFLSDRLDRFLAYRLEKEIFRRVIEPYLTTQYWWDNAKMNWSAVCAGSIGAASIYLVHDVELLTSILERVLASMSAFTDAFDKDGLITEGLAYWDYGFSFFTIFSELLTQRTAGSLSLLKDDKVRKIAMLPQILQFPSNAFVNFSDSGSARWSGNAGILYKLSQALDIKGYQYDGSFDLFSDNTYRFGLMARKLLWSAAADGETGNDAAMPVGIADHASSIKTGFHYFSESGWLVDRRIVSGLGFAAFAAKGGNNGEPHNHNDLGSFILHCGGNDLFVEIGSPEYVKEYFHDETRYDFLAASSFGHSVPVINGHPQSNGSRYYATVLDSDEKDGITSFKLDLQKAYDCAELTGFCREFTWDQQRCALDINDSFTFETGENEVCDVFITHQKPILQDAGMMAMHMDGFDVQLHYPKEAVHMVEECSYKDHFGKRSSIFRTSFLVNVQKNVELKFRILVIFH